MNEEKFNKMKPQTYLAIGQMLKLFASSAGISYNKFYQLMATCLVDETARLISPETVKRYTNRGIPQKLSYPRLSAAIERAYQFYISEQTLDEEKILMAKKAHDSYYPRFLSIVRTLYDIIELFDKCEPYMKVDLQMELTLQSFMNDVLFNNNEAPNQETLDLLKKSLQRFPPEGMGISK